MATQHSQAEYSLPGIMHYLQKETTKNERDRILWETEKAELKANIAKLEGHNKSLTERVKQLQNELNAAKKDAKSSSQIQPKTEFKEIDINPLAQAREKLQSQIKEISFLLNSTAVDFSKLELNSIKPFSPSNPGLHVDETTVESSLNSNTPLDSEKSIETPLTDTAAPIKVTTLETAQQNDDSSAAEPFSSVTDEVDLESDAETITDKVPESAITSNANTNSQTNIYHSGMEKFMLTSLASTVTAIDYNQKEILCASTDGAVKLWEIQDIYNSEGEVTANKSYYGEPNQIRFIKWINEEFFITISDNHIRFWNKNKNSPLNKLACPDVKSFDVNDSYLVITTADQKLHVNELVISQNGIKYTSRKDIKENCDYVSLDPKEKDHVLLFEDGGVQKYNLKKKTSVGVIMKGVDFATKVVSNFSVAFNYWCFVIDKDEVILYDPANKSVVLTQKYNTEIADVRVSQKHIVVFLTDGEIKIYETKNTAQMFKEYNIYKLFFTDSSDVTNEDDAILKNSLKAGQLFHTDYVIAGCEDSLVRGFKIQ